MSIYSPFWLGMFYSNVLDLFVYELTFYFSDVLIFEYTILKFVVETSSHSTFQTTFSVFNSDSAVFVQFDPWLLLLFAFLKNLLLQFISELHSSYFCSVVHINICTQRNILLTTTPSGNRNHKTLIHANKFCEHFKQFSSSIATYIIT